MLRWKKEKAREMRAVAYDFSVIWDIIDNINIAFGKIYKVSDVEVDVFDLIMDMIRITINSWQKRSFEEFDEDSNIFVVLSTIQSKLGQVREYFLDVSRFEDHANINSLRSQAMDHLLDIPSVIDQYTGINVIELSDLNQLMVRKKKISEMADYLVRESTSSNNSSSSSLSVFPIHGKPGSGKTSLVYLVYNLEIVRKYFDRRVWIRWENISGIHDDQEILRIVKERIDLDSKYLIVLEDLSNENGESWFDLLKPLLSAFASCKPGSKILVTSRNMPKKHIYGRLPMPKAAPYMMRVLHHDESLDLFQCIAFNGIEEEDRNPYMPIALEILEKCTNNPRVIRIIASFLSSQPPSKWQNFNEVVLNIPNPAKHILSIADLLMDDEILPHFLYYSLFPLGYEFDTLLAVLSNEYLFECCKRDKSGVIVSYKVKALAHVVAKHLARDKYSLVEKRAQEVNPLRIKHLSFAVDSSWKAPSWLYNAKFLRSLLFIPSKSCETNASCNLDEILENLSFLEALDLVGLICKNNQEFIGKLLQLRYLRLGVSSETLPEWITKLRKLETLDLRHSRVRELPVDFHELCFLEHLYVGNRLIDLPPRFGELTKLQTLDVFIVGNNNGLDALACLTHLSGKLKIIYQKGREEHVLPKDPTLFIKNTTLHELSLEWSSSNAGSAEIYKKEDYMELELLQPPSTLKILTVKKWKGERFPQWAMNQFSSLLSNLVFLHTADCTRCKHLPSFSKIGCLKYLELWGLIALEWIDNCGDNSMVSSETPYFPSLEHLSLINLPQLKGWSKEERQGADYKQEKHGKLSRLCDLKVSGCPELISMPQMPNLQSLEVSNIHGDLLQLLLSVQATPVSSSSASPVVPILQNLCSLKVSDMSIPEPLPRGLQYLTTIKELSLSWLYNLRILPESIGHLNQLHRLVIHYLPNLADFPESLAALSALRHIEIQYCPKLKQVPKYFSDLTSLQQLKIKECVNLERRCQQPDGEDWNLIKHIPNVHLGE